MNIGDRVVINKPQSHGWHGRQAVVVGNGYRDCDGQHWELRVSGHDGTYYFNESQMTMENVSTSQPVHRQSNDWSCHYCGMPAKSLGFFDEPICSECGG